MAPARKSKARTTPLDRLRRIVEAWPETDERISHGSPTWWGGKKTFASFHDDHHGDGRVALWVKSDFDTQQDLVEANPEFFFVPPYVGHKGWLGVEVGEIGGGPKAGLDWDVVAELLEAGYRSVAPKRALLQLDARAE